MGVISEAEEPLRIIELDGFTARWARKFRSSGGKQKHRKVGIAVERADDRNQFAEFVQRPRAL